MQIVWRQNARNNLGEIRRFVAERNTSAAKRLFSAVQVTVEHLARTPSLGRPGRVEGTRELVIPHTACVVAYIVLDEQLIVLAVLHQAQDWPDAF